MTAILKTVEIDLNHFTTNELIDELRSRGVPDNQFRVQMIYDAFHAGRDDDAVALTKSYVCDVTGRIL